MKQNRIQVILPDGVMEKFVKQAKKHNRPKSNLARLYILQGLAKDEDIKK